MENGSTVKLQKDYKGRCKGTYAIKPDVNTPEQCELKQSRSFKSQEGRR
jgi:hypothetical protein